MNYTEMKNKLIETLDKERYQHSLGTAECAQGLATKYNVDSDKAYLAGLLHDCAKRLDKEKTAEIAGKLTLEACEKNNPKTIHAPVSAWVAEHEYGVTDKEVLSAIRLHTIGKIDMTLLEKIVYIADKIEPKTRVEKYFQQIRDMLEEKGLDWALYVSYKNTIKSLEERGLEICPLTLDIYNNLDKKLNG